MRKILFALLAFSLVFTVGCDTGSDVTVEAPTAPGGDAVSIFADARVSSPSPGRIVAEDDSTSDPPGQINRVQFQLRSASGETTDSASTSAGSEVTFTGVASGTWTVEQSVFSPGVPTAERQYTVEVE